MPILTNPDHLSPDECFQSLVGDLGSGYIISPYRGNILAWQRDFISNNGLYHLPDPTASMRYQGKNGWRNWIKDITPILK